MIGNRTYTSIKKVFEAEIEKLRVKPVESTKTYEEQGMEHHVRAEAIKTLEDILRGLKPSEKDSQPRRYR